MKELFEKPYIIEWKEEKINEKEEEKEEGIKKKQKKEKIELNRKQIWCLLTHMFFTTMDESIHKYWNNFDIWYHCEESNNCVFSYLLTLFHYFIHISLNDNEIQNINPKNIIFEKITLEDNDNYDYNIDCNKGECNNIKWINLYDKKNNMLFDYNESQSIEFVVDFANSYVGFGISGTQEEMILGSSPESCIIMLLSPNPMKYGQIIVIQNVYVIAKFKNYGRNLSFEKCLIKDCNKKDNISTLFLRHIIAADASELDINENIKNTENIKILDLQNKYLKRDFIKAIAIMSLFQSNLLNQDIFIRSGLWGCGAFCGNKFIKTLIQFVAAHIFLKVNPNIHFKFYCIDDSLQEDSFSYSLFSFLKYKHDNHICWNHIWRFVLNNKSLFQLDDNIFQIIIQKNKIN
ncbi:hypothetical protein RFI_27554 [Reticulomyxa filosa]|uniref:poly(ADP-ribose) glycohydrolase n=1 Tax=Reticulomyxa filosa TaxID=46433 RepID=X6M859_RETFI|nr:hypothetical protein RFI_27554 [Reticulomyxa filosa]|eukprot:ETO09821.1 hypothetical protein RFI_27554 [Reticulomyxa filosa]